MNTRRRGLVELLAPPLLAAVALVVKSLKQETPADILLGFVPLVFACYVLGIIPSVLYTGVMEIWFRAGLGARLGLLCTALLSACLGAGAGWLSAWLGAGLGFSQSDRLWLLWLGIVIGLLIGFYVEESKYLQPNLSIERTGGSRVCPSAFVTRRRLPPMAHAPR